MSRIYMQKTRPGVAVQVTAHSPTKAGEQKSSGKLQITLLGSHDRGA